METKSTKKESALKYLITKLGEIDDYRDPDRLEYSLVEILFLALCGCMSGCESYQEIADFGNFKKRWLVKYLPYSNGIPSHDTIGRILSVLNTKQLEKALVDYCNFAIQLPTGAVVNIDGKAISRSVSIKDQQTKKSAGGKQAVIMVNVFCSEVESCLASVRVSSKTTEKKSLDELLELLDLSECLLTLDAGYCYTDVAKQIVNANADYLLGLKTNQPKLYDVAKDMLENSLQVETHKDNPKNGHGRVEQRSCSVLDLEKIKKEISKEQQEIYQKWPKLKCLIKVDCERTIISTNKTSLETRFYISSRKLTASKANETVRGHWAVENNLHWVLDAIFGEDRSTKREGNSAQNFSIIRKLAFNKLKAFEDPRVSMKRRMKKCAMSNTYLENTLEFL